jgi:4-amino-4-deoxy-L-arabinose transferase-like glycosyltransferase
MSNRGLPPTMIVDERDVQAGASVTRGTSRDCALDLIVVVVTALFVHASQLTLLPIRGEESRWARVAVEMRQTGDWFVPRQQGEPFLSRPPLHSWLMAVAGTALGELTIAAVRLPSVLAVVGTSIVVFLYGRSFLDRSIALVAGLAFPTMGQVLELGRRGESDAVFAFFLSSALLIWHLGWERGWPKTWTWIVGYALTALATLTKGVQAPTYFLGGVGIFLVVTGQLRRWFARDHLFGVAAFVIVFGAWQIPFAAHLGWDGVRRIWLWEVGLRFEDPSAPSLAVHWLLYPMELFISTLPWSIFLVGFVPPKRRRALKPLPPQALFLLGAMGLAFFSCWLVRGSQTRYLMSMYPMVALLAGYVVHRTMNTHAMDCKGQLLWLAPARVRLTAIVVALCLGAGNAGIVLPLMAGASEDMSSAVHELKTRIPAEQPLVSFGPVHHIFAFHYEAPIQLLAWPRRPADVPPFVDYFCFHQKQGQEKLLPFSWEQIGVLSCDRVRRAQPREMMVIGRRTRSVPG